MSGQAVHYRQPGEMNWQRAKREAERWRERLEGCVRRVPRGGEIVLTVYDGGATYRALNPGETWTVEEHTMVVRALARIIRREGLHVRIRTLSLRAYRAWLGATGGSDSRASRAAFSAQWPPPLI